MVSGVEGRGVFCRRGVGRGGARRKRRSERGSGAGLGGQRAGSGSAAAQGSLPPPFRTMPGEMGRHRGGGQTALPVVCHMIFILVTHATHSCAARVSLHALLQFPCLALRMYDLWAKEKKNKKLKATEVAPSDIAEPCSVYQVIVE